MVCGHWLGAQPQAFLKKMEIGGPNPNHKPQTTGGPFGLTSSHSGRPKVLPPPTPTLTHWEQSPAPLQEVRPGNEFPPFPFEKAGDQESCRNLLPFYSYKSISGDPNSPSRSHHSSKLESLDLISSRPSHTCHRAARSSLPARSGPAGPDAPGPCRSLLQALSITSPTSETPVLSAATWDRLWKGSSCNRSWSKAGLGKLLGGVTRRVGAKMSQLLNSRS